jgi:pimeloyl-ACP methyl ester carboxylesterase
MSRNRSIRSALLVLLAVALAFLPAAAQASNSADAAPKPTVVLVHGAFADSSSWDAVIQRLQNRGFTVIAAPNELRGVSADAAYVASILATISGPIVLVGHSYGGAVITEAAAGNPNVTALVYINAFQLDQGESLNTISARFPNNDVNADTTLVRPFPTATGGGADIYLATPTFREVFAADVPAAKTRLMAAEQRPLAASATGEPSGVATWRTVPSFALVSRQDRAIDPAAERFMAQRAGSFTIEIDSSHVAMISHPAVVTDLIARAARTTANAAAK